VTKDKVTNEVRRRPYGWQQNVCAMVGFGVSYKFLSSFNVSSRGTNTFSKSHHCANTNVRYALEQRRL